MTEEYAIEVEDLVKKFGDFLAVNHISFRVRAGEIFGFLGPNGSGKSTTIRMLCGLSQPTKGTGRVLGLDINREAEKIKQRIGYMSQRFSLYEDLTVDQNLTFYGGLYKLTGKRLRERKQECIRLADLERQGHLIVSSLPGGWKQRLALSCALLHEPKLVFLDEPTGGVDPITRRAFWDLLYSLCEQGVTMLVTTHYMDEAEHCDTIGFINSGRLIAFDTPGELKNKHMKGSLLEVECDNPMAAVEVLKPLPGVSEAAVYGSTLHVLVDDLARGKQQIEWLLPQQGFAVQGIRWIMPSLEDVFVSLINVEARESVRGKLGTPT